MRLQVMCMPCTGFIGCVWGRKNPRVDVLAGSSLLDVCRFSKGTVHAATTLQLVCVHLSREPIWKGDMQHHATLISFLVISQQWKLCCSHWTLQSNTRTVEHCNINWSSFPARAARYNISCAIHTGGPHLKKSSKNADIVYHEKPKKNWGTPLMCFWEHKHLKYIYICR